MSLKAKLEAVVYAAEEPVTLAQLAAIFTEDLQQEIEAASAQTQETEPEEASAAQEPEHAEAGADSVAAPEAAPTAEAAMEDARASEEASPSEVAQENAANTIAAAVAGQDVVAVEAPANEKKLARDRDRQLRQAVQRLLDELIADYAGSDRGMEIREIAGGYRMATKPEYHDAVRGFVKSLKPPMKLSLQALETLAVIAYKQPVTAPEVSDIRGVDSGGVLGGLVSRKLITTAGRKQVIGRPILYKTTKEFLLRFGLKDLNDLPSMEEFEKMAGELADVDEAAVPESTGEQPVVSQEVEGEEPTAEIAEESESQPAAEHAAESTPEHATETPADNADGHEVLTPSGITEES